MKSAHVYSMRAEAAHGFVWKWRSNDHAKKVSTMAFVCYEDCVADAQKSGYVVEVADMRSGETR
ncbi:MAG TPA: hypothetical protein VFB75_10625 [Burkholderiales bacterium]|nr:hypothetical protein [Burkholderiales bacterium]